MGYQEGRFGYLGGNGTKPKERKQNRDNTGFRKKEPLPWGWSWHHVIPECFAGREFELKSGRYFAPRNLVESRRNLKDVDRVTHAALGYWWGENLVDVDLACRQSNGVNGQLDQMSREEEVRFERIVACYEDSGDLGGLDPMCGRWNLESFRVKRKSYSVERRPSGVYEARMPLSRGQNNSSEQKGHEKRR